MLKAIKSNKNIKYHSRSKHNKMTYNLTSIGILIILIGFVLVFLGALTNLNSKDTKIAVGGFIGFIPFGFSNDKRLVWALVFLMGLTLAFFFAMNFFLQHRFK